MAKSSTKKRTTPQVANRLESGLHDSADGSDTRKKAKTRPSDSKFICHITIAIITTSLFFSDLSDQTRRSLRANKGSGGQIAQLRNIEHMQTQTIARVSPMDIATANKPLNPMALLSDKQPPKRKPRPSKGSAGEKAYFICCFSLPQTY